MDKTRQPLVIGAAALGLPAVVLGVFAGAQYRVWAGVTEHGVRTTAEVVGGQHFSKAADRVQVAFPTPDGRLVEASIPTWDLARYRAGDTIVVAYDPANPKRARTVSGWSPPYLFPIGIAALLALIAASLVLRAWRGLRARRAKTAKNAATNPR